MPSKTSPLTHDSLFDPSAECDTSILRCARSIYSKRPPQADASTTVPTLLVVEGISDWFCIIVSDIMNDMDIPRRIANLRHSRECDENLRPPLYNRNTTTMPRHVTSRAETAQCWFDKRILASPPRYALLLESVDGDDRWLDSVPHRDYPTWAQHGTKKRQFRSAIRRIARQLRASGGLAWPLQDPAGASPRAPPDTPPAATETTTAPHPLPNAQPPHPPFTG